MILERLPILILYPHSRCNCRCVMCDIWKVDSIQEISAVELQRHAGDIERLQVRWVVFSGGEPLMHSDLFRLTAILRERGIRTTILSTGLLLERFARQIRESIDDVIVSLDGPPEVHDRIRRVAGAFARMEAGVRALDGVPVDARSTVQRLNHARLRDTVSSARGLGLRSISFLAADVSSAAFNRAQIWPADRQNEIALTREEIPALEAEVEALIAARDPFVLEGPEKLRRIVRHFQAHLGMADAEAPRCNAPWVSAVVESDGAVRPCFFHAPIGTLRGRSLFQVLNSPEAQAFRAGLNVAQDPTCCRCVCSLHLQDDARTLPLPIDRKTGDSALNHHFSATTGRKGD